MINISQLISKLEELKTKHGDVVVVHFDRGYAESFDLDVLGVYRIEKSYIDSQDMVDHWYKPDEPLLGTEKVLVV